MTLPVYLIFPYDYINHLENKNFALFNWIKRNTGVYDLNINNSLKIPDIKCETISIYDRDSHIKMQAVCALLEHFLSKHQRDKNPKALRVLI